MGTTYQKLLDDWRAAANDTRKAQQALKDRFELFIQGQAPEPREAEVQEVQRLRDAEHVKLQAAMAYVRNSAHGHP